MSSSSSSRSSSESEGSSWGEWQGDSGMTLCLGCSLAFDEADEAVSHLQTAHGFDLPALVRRSKLDFYGSMKLINHLRAHQKSSAEQAHLDYLASMLSLDSASLHALVADESLLAPVLPDDPLLSFDLHPEDDEAVDTTTSNPVAEVNMLKDMLANYRLMTDQLIASVPSASPASIESARDAAAVLAPLSQVKPATVDDETDVDDYFSSYSRPSMHMEMIKDTVRTNAYRDFILGNPTLFADKIVLDIGCGTGILSMFAAQSGAKHVYGVDMSNVVYRAMQNVLENGFENKITIIRGMLEEISLPVANVDIIISEWMGYGLLYESMLDSVLFARDKWLAPGGVVHPDQTAIYVAAIANPEWRKEQYDYWNNVYGFKMNSMLEWTLADVDVALVPEGCMISAPFVLKNYNMADVVLADLQFKQSYQCVINRPGESLCDGLVIHFDIAFEAQCLERQVYFNTSCDDIPTHWKQSSLYFPNPLKVKFGDVVTGELTLRRRKQNHRALEVVLTYGVTGSQETKTVERFYRFQ